MSARASRRIPRPARTSLAVLGVLTGACASSVQQARSQDTAALCRAYDGETLPAEVRRALDTQPLLRLRGRARPAEGWKVTLPAPAVLVDFTLVDLREAGYGLEVWDLVIEDHALEWRREAGPTLWTALGYSAPSPARVSPQGADGLIMADLFLNLATGGLPWLMGLRLSDDVQVEPASPGSAPADLNPMLAGLASISPANGWRQAIWRGGGRGGLCILVPGDSCSQTTVFIAQPQGEPHARDRAERCAGPGPTLRIDLRLTGPDCNAAYTRICRALPAAHSPGRALERLLAEHPQGVLLP